MIDGEAAFSEKNINSLEVDDLEAVRVWPTTGRKVTVAERAIRTVRLLLWLLLHFFAVQRGDWENHVHKKTSFV